MSSDEKKESEQPEDSPVSEQVLELNFVPQWARQPPSADPYRDARGGEDTPRRERRTGGSPRDRRQTGARGPRQDRRPAERSGRRPEAGENRRGARDRGDAPRDRRPPPAPSQAPLPIQVSFIPGQKKLTAMAADIRTAQHAFPLPELAHLFLSSPDWHLVKFEAHKQKGGAYATEFYQSRLNGRLFMDRNEAWNDVTETALATCFIAETQQQDPPAGNFVCVGRCRLSGELLGPPNYHGYNEQVETLHRTRFPRMSLDEYRREIETVRDPELVERWKEEWRTRTVYRLKPEYGGAEDAEAMSEKQARTYVQEHIAPKQVVKVKRAIVPGRVSRDIRDPRLLSLLRAAWGREQRFPVTLIRALRGAFRRMGMHLFETPGNVLFVTGIPPRPVDPARVVDNIRDVLEWLHAHPGCTRQELVHGVRPDTEAEPSQLGAVLHPLTWLIERGHVIEFHNGTLAVPQ